MNGFYGELFTEYCDNAREVIADYSSEDVAGVAVNGTAHMNVLRAMMRNAWALLACLVPEAHVNRHDVALVIGVGSDAVPSCCRPEVISLGKLMQHAMSSGWDSTMTDAYLASSLRLAGDVDTE